MFVYGKAKKKRQLYDAAERGDAAAIRKLVAGGANVNWRKPGDGKWEWTHLHAAAYNGHVEAVQALLRAGADVGARDQSQRTPLHAAAKEGHLEALQALLQAGADVGARDKTQWTPLHAAAKAGHVEAMQALLQAGADVGARDENSRATPLHEAAWNCHVEAVWALLQAGADVCAKSKDGYTPLHSAAWKGQLQAVMMLLEAGADVDAKDKDADTPLHNAARRGRVEVVKALLEAGADKRVANEEGDTPLDLADKEQVKEALRAAASRPSQVAASSPSNTAPALARTPPLSQPSSALALYTGGPVTLPSPLAGGQVKAVVAALVGAGLLAAAQVVGAVATCNPAALVKAPLELLKLVQTMLQQGHYCRQRVQRMAARIAVLEPALRQLAQELQPPMRTSAPVGVVQSLCAMLILLVHVLAQLQELQHKLLSNGEGSLQRMLQALKASGYEQDVAALDLELRDCLTQLSAILGIAQFTQAPQWHQQNEADRAVDLQQLEGMMVEAAGGVKALQQQLQEQRVVLDGQVVGLQQVAEWLQQMQAGSSIISQHLQELQSKVHGIKGGIEKMHVDLGARMDSMQDEFGAQLSQLLHFMSSKRGATHKGMVPAMVIERSRIVLAADALAQGTPGGFGTVVKAVHDGGEVAVKVYNHRVLGEIDSEEAMGEALLLSKANHHNVVRCFGVVHDPDAPQGSSLHGSLVMEWVGGGNLYKWLQGNRGLGLQARAQLALQVAAGMRHLHERRLVHGDLKPQNVLLTPVAAGTVTVPQAKICDFGLAKHTSTTAQFSYQRNKAYTPVYTSPERMTTWSRTKQDDVYAFGILLYFIATSRNPFGTIPQEQLGLAVTQGARPDIDQWLQGQASSGVQHEAAVLYCQLAKRCWAADPGQRPMFQAIYGDLATLLTRLQV